MKQYGSSTSSTYVTARSSIGLPSAAVGTIVFVTDESKCSRASRAIDSAHVGTPAGSPVYLVQVGTHYMAMPPSTNGLIIHLDNLFTVKNTLVQQ